MTVRKRGDVFHYQFQFKGQTFCGTLPDVKTEADARQAEQDERAKVRLGLRPDAKPVDDDFCKFVNEVYLKYSRENKASHVHDEFRCRMLTDYFEGKRFSEIKPLTVVAFMKHRLGTKIKRYRQRSKATRFRSPVTVHKEVTLLSEIFSMAIQEKRTTDNPCKQIPKAARKLIRPRSKRSCAMTTDKEVMLLSKGLTGRYAHLKPIVLFDLHTGLRLGELTRLERPHINLEPDSKWFDVNGESFEVPQDCLIVIQTKNRKPRVIPLNASARAVAVHQLNDATVGQYFFPSSKKEGEHVKEVKKGMAGACKQAGIKYGQYEADGITFHTLRHWFNTKLEDMGVSKTVRRDLLGHEPRDVTDDYTHSTIEMRRRAVNLLCQTSGENVLNFERKSGKSLATG